ncbi:uncharacterized protein ACBT57_006144 isoform 1-T2 [Dama dama]
MARGWTWTFAQGINSQNLTKYCWRMNIKQEVEELKSVGNLPGMMLKYPSSPETLTQETQEEPSPPFLGNSGANPENTRLECSTLPPPGSSGNSSPAVNAASSSA